MILIFLKNGRKNFRQQPPPPPTVGRHWPGPSTAPQEIDKKIEMAKVQQELLMDSLNPAAKEAADRRKQLVKVKEEMQERLDGLNTRAAGFLEHFRITEQALITAGQAFTHPHDELQQTNENRKLKILEYHKLGAAEIAEGEELVAAMEQVCAPHARAPPCGASVGVMWWYACCPSPPLPPHHPPLQTLPPSLPDAPPTSPPPPSLRHRGGSLQEASPRPPEAFQ